MKKKLTVGYFKKQDGQQTNIPRFNQFPKHFFCQNGEVINLKNGKTVKPWVKDNHLYVALNYKRKRVQDKLGRLIALLYVANPNGYKKYIHKDGNLKNVGCNNLAWVSDDYQQISQRLDESIKWLAIVLLLSFVGFVTMLIFTFLA